MDDARDGHDRLRDDQLLMETGRPQLWPQQGAAFSYRNYEQKIVQVNRAALEEVAGERGTAPGQLVLDHTVRPDERALRVWRSSVQLISHTVLDRKASPLLQAEMGRLGALALLELYPVVSASLPDELLLPRNAHVRRAVEYVHEHAHLPITSTDLARVASLSLRALQIAFQRAFELSPNAYIRQVRLDRVRDALLQGDPATTSIAEVAKQWGFAHAGRFSATYQQRHGEYPRDTCADARSARRRVVTRVSAPVGVDEQRAADRAEGVDELVDRPPRDAGHLEVVRPECGEPTRADPHDLPPDGPDGAVLPTVRLLPRPDVFESVSPRAVVLDRDAELRQHDVRPRLDVVEERPVETDRGVVERQREPFLQGRPEFGLDRGGRRGGAHARERLPRRQPGVFGQIVLGTGGRAPSAVHHRRSHRTARVAHGSTPRHPSGPRLQSGPPHAAPPRGDGAAPRAGAAAGSGDR